MAFLCEKHLNIVKNNPALGLRLWQGAFANGEGAYRKHNWKSACSFFGAAYEISSVCMAERVPAFDPMHVSNAGQCLVNSLCQLGDLPKAQSYLLNMGGELEHMANDEKLQIENRTLAKKLVNHVHCRLMHIMRVNAQSWPVEYECLGPAIKDPMFLLH